MPGLLSLVFIMCHHCKHLILCDQHCNTNNSSISSCPAMSFDLYAKYGSNRTMSLVNPKKPYYQWRLRVPSGHVVQLVILTLHGATPGSCTAHKLSAYDFLLPLQNKIIARLGHYCGLFSSTTSSLIPFVFLDAFSYLRWCGLPVSGSSPVIRLTSSGNVMLVTFSFSRQRDAAIFKAYFQAIPKAGWSALMELYQFCVCSCYC